MTERNIFSPLRSPFFFLLSLDVYSHLIFLPMPPLLLLVHRRSVLLQLYHQFSWSFSSSSAWLYVYVRLNQIMYRLDGKITKLNRRKAGEEKKLFKITRSFAKRLAKSNGLVIFYLNLFSVQFE